MVTLSVIIPVYNEEGSIGTLLADLEAALDRVPAESEIIVVDDGSSDATMDALECHRVGSRRLRVLALRRNFGQTSAMVAGFHAARGDAALRYARGRGTSSILSALNC